MDVGRAREALQALPPDLPRDEWVRAGMAAHAAGLTLDDFDSWSAGGASYDARAARDVWRSFKAGAVGPATLYAMARAAGWKPAGGAEGARQQPRPSPSSRKPQAERPRQGPSAAEVWARCTPATAGHPYIAAKQGTAEGLRVVPEEDPLRIAGEPMSGALVIPCYRADGTLATLQFVTVDETAARLKAAGRPSKLNLPGHPVEGWFTVGDVSAGGTVYLCEGIGQAWACWKATGHAAVVAFGWSRVRAVAQALRQRDPAARITICPDRGKEGEAEAIAREVRAGFVTMPEGWPANADVSDLAQRDGFDVLEALLSKPQTPEQRFRLLGSEDLRAMPPLAWRVRGVLPAHGLAAVYGASASGKTFLTLDVAAAIADGADWFGCRVKPAPVIYCALEGEAGFRLRVAAWEQANGQPLPAGLRLVLQPFKLTEPQDVDDLAAAVLTAGAGAVTVLGTLNRAAPGADENSSQDMGAILEAAKELQRLTDGLVVLVHHSGKDSAKGLRGHSSLFAALDAVLEVSRDGDRREWRVAKSKDGRDGEARPFKLRVVDLGADEDGEALTSCVVVADTGPAEVQRAKLPQGGNQRIALEALRPMFRASSAFGRGGAPAVRPCLALEEAITGISTKLVDVNPARRVARAREAVTGLVSRGVLGCGEAWLWLV